MAPSDPLPYEPNASARPVFVEQDGSDTRIVVRMQRLYVPVPHWVFQLDLLALLAVPIARLASLLIGLCFRLPTPPRALFEIAGEQWRITLRDPATGETRFFEFPQTSILEARANRFERGLWLNVTGQVKDTFLSDLNQETIKQLESALSSILVKST